MSWTIRMAISESDIDGVFQLRHRVYVDEEHYMPPTSDHRIFDRFDAYPTTRSFCVMSDGVVVGSARFSEKTSVGMPADEFFDFEAHFAPDSKVGCVSMLCLREPYRRVPGLLLLLLGKGFSWGVSRGWTIIVAAVNPKISRIIERFGGKRVASEMCSEAKGLSFVPMTLDVSSVNPKLLQFVGERLAE